MFTVEVTTAYRDGLTVVAYPHRVFALTTHKPDAKRYDTRAQAARKARELRGRFGSARRIRVVPAED